MLAKSLLGTLAADVGATSTCTNPTCSSPPCAADIRGDVGCTTVSGIESYNHKFVTKGGTVESGSHIYGPFEAGFAAPQKAAIESWGCTDPTVAYDAEGGTDTKTAEKKVAYLCGITFPRIEGDDYIGIVGPCGGHTKDYHFHERYSCLYKEEGGHSTAVGDVGSWKLYGKWEDFSNNKLPLLDACSGHFGPTPDSSGATVYHHHVQDKAPFAVGCHGPTADGKLVSVAACRALYSTCSNAADSLRLGANEVISYVRDCPCWDANWSNSGSITELPALSSTEISYTASATSSATTSGTTTVTTTGSVTTSASTPQVVGTAMSFMTLVLIHA